MVSRLLLSVLAAEFPGCHLVSFFKRPVEITDVCVAYFVYDFLNAEVGVYQ